MTSRKFVCGCLLSLLCPIVWGQQPSPPNEAGNDALRVIEDFRGGRHWVDEKVAEPKPPEESLSCLEIEPGFEIQLVAAEPLVMDPVAISFDHLGRMFVVEYGDYPVGPGEGLPPLSRVVILEDKDRDGRMDHRTVFADQLNFAHSLMPYNDGILVGAKTQLLFLKDSDDDGVADVKQVLFDGFTPAHPQMQIGNPRFGMDNWVYCNYGPGKVFRPGSNLEPVALPRKDFRFNPQSMAFESDAGLGQFGNTIDRWGNRFYCTNRNPIMTTVFSPTVLNRNPQAILSGGHYDVAPSGGQTRVYPLVEMKSNYLSHAGTHTAACGVTANLGDRLGEGAENSVFVCEPIGHLVTRSSIEPEGTQLIARRVREKADFLASTDTWFRPSSLATGPDGAMYLADMYRMWVEHPKFLPPEIAEKLNWRAGEDRGRIYRILRRGTTGDSFSPPQEPEDCLSLLQSRNAWRQYLGHRLIVERGHVQLESQLREMLVSEKQETVRLHALWSLQGLQLIRDQDLLIAMKDASPVIRRDAVRLLKKQSMKHLQQDMLALLHDHDGRVRLSLAIQLGEWSDADSTEALGALAISDGDDPWIAKAILSSSKDRAGPVLAILARAADQRTDALKYRDLMKQLASCVGARGDHAELADIIKLIAGAPSKKSWVSAALVSGLGTGLARHRGHLGRTNLASLIAKPPQELAGSINRLKDVLQRGSALVLDSSRDSADRIAAIELLPYSGLEVTRNALSELLSRSEESTIQLAAIDAVASLSARPEIYRIMLSHWQRLSPAARAAALGMLLRRNESTLEALDAMERGEVQASILSIDQRVRLLKHSSEPIRALSNRLLGGAVSADRRAVVQKYRQAIEGHADAASGAKVFRRVCANCHKVDGLGNETGPDLSDVRNRSKLALLHDILDPNAKVEPRFNAYNVLTIDGRALTGLIESENSESVTLRMSEGKLVSIPREDIEELRVSSVSLMPEGVEKDVKVEEMAALLEYLKSPMRIRVSDL